MLIGSFDSDRLRETFGISDRFKVQLVIAIGKPAEERRIVEIENGGSTHYYREDGVHYVPTRKLEDIIIEH